ncbi:MAG: GYF domain-containing protein [Myxococcales bacterium]|jgi:predicted Zn finger-like uncharacterized protein
MRFACDSCHAQYQISDEKVGPNGVIVRCKKCQHKIVVKPPIVQPQEDEPSEATQVMPNPTAPLAPAAGFDDDEATVAGDAPFAAPPADSTEAGGAFAGLDDELGRAFESVLTSPSAPPVDAPETTAPGTDPIAQPSGFPFPARSDEAGDDDPNRQSTRVVNLTEMASLMKPDPRADEPTASSGEGSADEQKLPGAKAAEKTEWYVAIRDQQVGPLDFDGVRERWDAGELSADSLVWNAGMTDWRPLSTVAELADKLVPRHQPKPGDSEQPGADILAPSSALPPPQAEPEEPAWKPSAASALEALVKDELDALERQPAKPEPPVAESAPAPSGGLFDDMPDAPEPPFPVSVAPAAPPSPEPAAAGEAGPAAEPEAERPERVVARAPARRNPPHAPAPAYPPPSYAPPPRPRMGLWVGLGIAGGIGVAALGLVLAMIVLKPAVVVPPEPVAVQQPPAPQPPAGQGDQGATASQGAAKADEGRPADEKAPEVAKAEEAAKPDEKKPDEAKVDEPKASQPKEAPAVKQAERSAPKETRRPERRPERREREPTKVAREEPPPREKEPEPPPKPKPQPEREVASPSASSVDDDFDRIFGGGSSRSAPPEPKRAEKRPSTVYIPPAPGGGAIKETLGQSDIMEVVLANRSSIKRCTDEQKARDPGSAGTITMRWIINKDGRTSGIRALTREYQKSELSACLAGVIKNFRFPPYSGKQMQPIDFPFKF